MPRSLATGAAAVALLLAAACTGDGGEPQDTPTSSPTTTAPSPTPHTTSPAGTSPPPSPSVTGTAPSDQAQARTEVTKTWKRFFSPQTPLKDKIALVEDGEQYALMVQGFAQDERARQLRAHLIRVAFTSPIRADVGYTLSRQDRTVTTHAPGTTVLQDDTWKISFTTLCALTRYGTDVPRAATCPDPP